MSVQVMIDGVLSPSINDARVSVFDRGFLYGDSVFETIRTYQGKPFALEEHLDRLQGSAGKVFIELPVAIDVLAQEIHECLDRARNSESYVRVIVTRGAGPLGLDIGLSVLPTRVVVVTPLSVPTPTFYAEGISVVTYQSQRPGDLVGAEGAKLGNYLVAVLAGRAAKAEGAREALIVNSEGGITEGATSNLFWVEGGRVLTPGLDAGVLAGITRANIIECAATLGVEVGFETPDVGRLRRAAEVFISSSIRELVGVVAINGHVIGRGSPGKLTQRLHSEFRRRVLGTQ